MLLTLTVAAGFSVCLGLLFTSFIGENTKATLITPPVAPLIASPHEFLKFLRFWDESLSVDAARAQYLSMLRVLLTGGAFECTSMEPGCKTMEGLTWPKSGVTMVGRQPWSR